MMVRVASYVLLLLVFGSVLGWAGFTAIAPLLRWAASA